MSTRTSTPVVALAALLVAGLAVLGLQSWEHKDETEVSMVAVWGNGAPDNAPKSGTIAWFATANGPTSTFTIAGSNHLGDPPVHWQKTIYVPRKGQVLLSVVPDDDQPVKACTITARIAGRVVKTVEGEPLVGHPNGIQCRMDPVP